MCVYNYSRVPAIIIREYQILNLISATSYSSQEAVNIINFTLFTHTEYNVYCMETFASTILCDCFPICMWDNTGTEAHDYAIIKNAC